MLFSCCSSGPKNTTTHLPQLDLFGREKGVELTPYSKKTTLATSSPGTGAGGGGPSDGGVSFPRAAGSDAGVCGISSDAGVSGTDDAEKGSRGLRVKTGESEMMYPWWCALGEYAAGKYIPGICPLQLPTSRRVSTTASLIWPARSTGCSSLDHNLVRAGGGPPKPNPPRQHIPDRPSNLPKPTLT
jgi:hypothetical protein